MQSGNTFQVLTSVSICTGNWRQKWVWLMLTDIYHRRLISMLKRFIKNHAGADFCWRISGWHFSVVTDSVYHSVTHPSPHSDGRCSKWYIARRLQLQSGLKWGPFWTWLFHVHSTAQTLDERENWMKWKGWLSLGCSSNSISANICMNVISLTLIAEKHPTSRTGEAMW